MQQQQDPSVGIYPTCPPPPDNGQEEQQQRVNAPPVYPSQQTYVPQQPYQGQGFPMQQQYVPTQPQTVPVPSHQSVVYQRTQSRVWPHYRNKSSYVIGWIQISIGLMCITFNAIGLSLQMGRDYKERNATFMVGAGFWGSIFFFLSGGFAIGAAKHKTTSMIVANMVFSILSTIFAVAVLSTGGSAVGVEKSNVRHWDHENYFTFRDVARQDTREHRASLTMGILLVGLALLEFVCCIWSSIICCSAVCCGQTSANPMTMAQTQLIFMNTPQSVANGQPVQGVQGSQMVVVNNPGYYNQPTQGYVSYSATPNAPPSYDSTVGPTIEKQNI